MMMMMMVIMMMVIQWWRCIYQCHQLINTDAHVYTISIAEPMKVMENIQIFKKIVVFISLAGSLLSSNGSVLDHRSLPPVFESRREHIWRMFHLWLRFITFGGHSAHLAYRVYKSGPRTSITIINPNSVYYIHHTFALWQESPENLASKPFVKLVPTISRHICNHIHVFMV